MSWFLPETYLRWSEPKLTRRTRYDLEAVAVSPWFRPLAFLAGCALLLLLKHPGFPTWPVPFIAAFFVYVWPLINRFLPCDIAVTEAGISVIVANHATRLKYKDIQSCDIARQGETTVLGIATRRGRSWLLGVAPSVSIVDLQGVLRERGVEVCGPQER
jgi:hypothetical protein